MKKLVIIDLSNFIFRAFFAIRPLHSPGGIPVNAVYGVLTMLQKIFRDYSPTHVLVAMDSKGDTFRTKIYPDYKANRSEPPDDLVPQFELIFDLIKKMKLPYHQINGYEADDIIGTMVVQYKNDFDEILIASGDKDLMQFVDEKVKILDTMKEKILGRVEVKEKMGVWPEQIQDFLSLTGDSSDNIPGVPGIGPKGASTLLDQFNDLDTVLKNTDKIKNKKTQNALIEHQELAIISKKLVKIFCELDLNKKNDEFEYKFTIDSELYSYLDSLGFKNFLEKNRSEVISQIPLKNTVLVSSIELKEIEEVFSSETFKQKIQGSNELILHVDWINENEFFSLAKNIFVLCKGKALSISFAHHEFWEILSTEKQALIAWDLKAIAGNLTITNGLPKNSLDLSQAHFLIDPDSKNDFNFAVEYYLHEKVDANMGQADFFEKDTIPTQRVLSFLAKLKTIFMQELEEKKLLYPLEKIDLPLIPILAEIEKKGIALDVNYFELLERDFDSQLVKIEEEIKKISGEDINLRSPKQVGELLFEKLQLPIIRKTKTGYSTDAEVLMELVQQKTSPIPELILKYRELEKLNSTYVRIFPKLLNEKTGKLHTHYKLANAATGRLSSDHPNLQNIPIRTVNGQKLRKGFKADEGCLLLSADYSQVELRLLAHFSQDPVMLDAFAHDKDIHIQTASEIFEIPINQVNKEQRNSAKAINFGLMYGQSSFGLSKTLGIAQGEAKNYITNYFRRFQKVKAYLDHLREKCEEVGFAETFFGRKRYLPNIHSSNRQIKNMAERMAINSPIQGTAADIIKIAMINIDRIFKKKKFKSYMVLQVHDELIFNVFPDELDQLKSIVPYEMENAVNFSVRLKVDVNIGQNWLELK